MEVLSGIVLLVAVLAVVTVIGLAALFLIWLLLPLLLSVIFALGTGQWWLLAVGVVAEIWWVSSLT